MNGTHANLSNGVEPQKQTPGLEDQELISAYSGPKRGLGLGSPRDTAATCQTLPPRVSTKADTQLVLLGDADFVVPEHTLSSFSVEEAS